LAPFIPAVVKSLFFSLTALIGLMFYSENILVRKGPLANYWLAAHWDRKLTKTQIFQANIQTSVSNLRLF
jgi:hypothetical protein